MIKNIIMLKDLSFSPFRQKQCNNKSFITIELNKHSRLPISISRFLNSLNFINTT